MKVPKVIRTPPKARQTPLKVIGFSVSVTCLIVLFLYSYSLLQPTRILKQDTHIDTRVTSVITHGSPKGTIIIKIFGLGSRYAHIGYGFRYTTNGVQKNISTIDTPINVQGKDDVEFQLYLGTCVNSVCTTDTKIADEWVLLEYTDISGKKILTGTP